MKFYRQIPTNQACPNESVKGYLLFSVGSDIGVKLLAFRCTALFLNIFLIKLSQKACDRICSVKKSWFI